MPVTAAFTKRKRTSGTAMMELVLFAPWIFMLSIGALDWGFYSSALISLQAGVRSAALYTSQGPSTAADSDTACTIVLGEMRKLPNIGSAATCPTTNPAVTATSYTGPDGQPATRVSVSYQSISLIPIPGLLAQQFTITRTLSMRVRSAS
jgi:Flp pilus assembly protein TadG